MAGRCPVPDCQEPRPEGPFALFCAEHHFMLPRKDTAFLTRWQVKISRCSDDEVRTFMREQLQGYVAAAIRKIEAVQH